jgi:hypothetical protein
MALRTGLGSIVALASATSANGVARNGATLALSGVKPGSLLFEVQASITTASVLATFTVQASMNATDWFDVYVPAVVSVATPTGTGSAVTTRRVISLPSEALSSFAFVRVNSTLSGGATAGADVSQATYRFRRYGVED